MQLFTGVRCATHDAWSSSCSPCALVKNEETHILTMNQENGDASWSMGFTYPG
jgi:hypothetical protein